MLRNNGYTKNQTPKIKETAVFLVFGFWFLISPVSVDAADYGGYRPHYQGFGTGATGTTPLLSANKGGRGGTIYRVNTLADNNNAPVAVGDGTFRSSLRAAANSPGPRIIIFEISGTIVLSSILNVTVPFLTIAGQTAPSPGINITGGTMVIQTHDVVVQHLRFRFGRIGSVGSFDSIPLKIGGATQWTYNVVVDHVSVAFANGYMSIASYSDVSQPNPWDVAVLDSLIAYPLAADSAYTGYGLRFWTVGNGQATAARNLFVHSSHRNLSGQGGKLQWVNNLVYGSGPSDDYTTLSFQGPELPIGSNESNPTWALFGLAINNRFLPSIGTGSGSTAGTSPQHKTFTYTWFRDENVFQRGDRIWLEGNVGPGVTGPSIDQQWAGISFAFAEGSRAYTRAELGFPSVPSWHTQQNFDTIPTANMPAHLMANAGARPLDRDAVDSLAVSQTQAALNGGTANASWGSRIIDPSEVGGIPVLPTNTRALQVPTNPNQVVDSAGRTAIEVWLETYACALEPACNATIPPPPPPPPPPSTITLTPSGTSATSGSALSVNWTAPAGSAVRDWITIVPVNSPDNAWDQNRWVYTQGAQSGTYNTTAPTTAGSYQFRYLLNDGFVVAFRSAAITVTASACDLDGNGTVNVGDVQVIVNETIGISQCVHDLNQDSRCNIIDIQRLVNAALGGPCVTQ